jgi:hypothetical protein
MIGLHVEPAALHIAAEFFELFKTPWERVVPGRKYQVALSTDGDLEIPDADVLLMYGSHEREIDRQAGATVAHVAGSIEVEFEEWRVPVYGGTAHFEGIGGDGFLMAAGKCVGYRHSSGGRNVWRIGYDLFSETRHLLSIGQPRVYAQTPTLELHIDLLRRLLHEAAVSFIEVPPRPAGYEFTCCLTHDLDFFGIRRHAFDRTLGGFIARSSLGTLVDWLRGRRPPSDLMRNWRALASLPFVFLRIASDFWRPVEDYLRVEDGRRSTFFVVPFKDRPGLGPDDTVNSRRAVRYQASEVGEELRHAAAQGSEIALHGIDAWRDADAGRDEMREVIGLTDQSRVGVRMHWLYFADESPRYLESAGFAYDSTWGYNDAVGYRAGTSQVFRLSGTRNLLELPLAIMDTALLYRGRMNLQQDQALDRCLRVVAAARRFGGTLVINWHDRSLAPERLWDDLYRALLHEVSASTPVWFATASEAVDWFRWRRSISFNQPSSDRLVVTAGARGTALPPARLRIHRPGGAAAGTLEEILFAGDNALAVCL